MEEDDKKRIQANYKRLVDELYVTEVDTFLFQEGAITDEECQYCNPHEMRITRQEGARRLITYLKKRRNGFKLLCEALRLIGSDGGDDLANTLEATDPSKVESIPGEDLLDNNSDSSVVKAQYGSQEVMNQFSYQMSQQIQLIMEYKQEIDQLRKDLDNEKQQKSIVESKLNDKKKEFDEKKVTFGIGENVVGDYMSDVMARDLTPDVTDYGAGDSKVPYLPDTTEQVNFTEAVCRSVAEDSIYFICYPDHYLKKPPSIYAQTMRRTVKEMTDKNKQLFVEEVTALKFTQANGLEMLQNIGNVLFDKSQKTNWGRVVAYYAFGGWVSKYCLENDTSKGNPQFPLVIADFIGFYTSRTVGNWIDEQGGWDSFISYFPEKKDSGSCVIY